MMMRGKEFQLSKRSNQGPLLGSGGGQSDQETLSINREDEATKRPARYKVLLHNDDYTTMEFVVLVLQKIFHKNLSEAQTIMLSVHERGVGVCGIYSYEVAETKVFQVEHYARTQSHPLKCTMEPE